ncbi:hypothetical protein C8R46DRAFT_465341 [Mycena filopes]|nr:hypothetical protein C8R46DRAFT_465341 [Mycena filopes]
MSNLLLVATERLGQETNRANALDARCAEVLAHLRTIVEDRDQLRRNLARVQEELGLYKLQLDVAQNEIFRAQKIVDGVDKARVEAEEQAAKDRTLARQLVSERAVWVAREEGRNEGYKEGLREGRRLAYDASRKRPSRTRARTATEEYTDGGYQDDDEPETYEPSRHSSPSSRRHWSSPSRSVHSTLPPDGASYASTLPIHAMEQRDPSDGPSTQSNPPSSESHQQPPRPPSAPHPERSPTARSSRPLPRAPERLPEPIDIRPDRRTFRASSPSMSHRSVALPPDGFIPTTGVDSVIALPPPHELSRPVSIVDDRPRTPATERTGTATPSRRRTMSNVSAVSTRMSQYDILHPPRTSAPEAATRSHQVAQEWRIANAVPDPAEQRRGTSGEDFNGSENFSTRSSIPRSQTSRRTGPRRPREIVMPMPLSTTMHAVYARQPTSAPAAPEQQPIYAPSNGASSSTLYAPPPSVPALQEYFDTNHDTGPTRSRSAMAWLKTRFARRSFSSSSVPNIQIEPPSNPASNPSTEQTMDNVLLAPDDAEDPTLAQHLEPAVADAIAEISMQPVPVPPPEPYPLANPVQFAQGNGRGSSAGHVSELPRGFVPLSPISPILPDLHTVTPFPLSSPTPATVAPPPAATPSPQPPAYTPCDIYYTPLRPATAGGMRSPPRSEVGGGGSIRSNGRARGASVGSALLASPAPLNRPLSIFSEA